MLDSSLNFKKRSINFIWDALQVFPKIFMELGNEDFFFILIAKIGQLKRIDSSPNLTSDQQFVSGTPCIYFLQRN